MREYDIGEGFKLVVEGDTLSLLDPDTRATLYRHEATYRADTPFYTGLEGFCAWVGDGLRLAMATMSQGAGRVIYLYDHRKPFYPKISDITDTRKRRLEQGARMGEPELYGPDGEMLEWQSGGCFGYAWNLDVDYFSEWGNSPFPQEGETVDDVNQRHAEARQNMMDAFGGEENVFRVEGPQITAASVIVP